MECTQKNFRGGWGILDSPAKLFDRKPYITCLVSDTMDLTSEVKKPVYEGFSA